MLLSKKPDAVDHLLGSSARCFKPVRQSSVLSLQILDALRRHDALHSGGLQPLETRLSLQGATPE